MLEDHMNLSRPRIAICWSGQLRTGKRALPYLMNFFKNTNADHFITVGQKVTHQKNKNTQKKNGTK